MNVQTGTDGVEFWTFAAGGNPLSPSQINALVDPGDYSGTVWGSVQVTDTSSLAASFEISLDFLDQSRLRRLPRTPVPRKCPRRTSFARKSYKRMHQTTRLPAYGSSASRRRCLTTWSSFRGYSTQGPASCRRRQGHPFTTPLLRGDWNHSSRANRNHGPRHKSSQGSTVRRRMVRQCSQRHKRECHDGDWQRQRADGGARRPSYDVWTSRAFVAPK